MQKVAARATMRLAKVVNFESTNDENNNSINQTVISFNKMASPPNVGGSKSSKRGTQQKSSTEIEVVTTDPAGFGREQQLTMYKSGLLSHVVEQVKLDLARGTVPSHQSTPDNVKKINTSSKLEEQYAEKNSRRKKANTGGKTAEQVADILGSKVKRAKRSARRW